MKKYLPLAALLAFTALTPAAMADGGDPVLPSDSRIKVLTYDESDIYTITTKYGFQTHIVFAPDEEIMTISMGDRSLWQIIPAGHRLFIRPMDEGVTTNMTILTSKRSYQFDLKSLSGEKSGAPLYVAKFAYPDKYNKVRTMPSDYIPAVKSAPPAGFVPVSTTNPAVATPAGANNYNYTFSGPDTLAPTQVFDDGKSTYIKYRKLGEPLPKLMARDSGGNPVPLSYSVKDNQIVTDSVLGEMELIHPTGSVVIYNELLNPQ